MRVILRFFTKVATLMVDVVKTYSFHMTPYIVACSLVGEVKHNSPSSNVQFMPITNICYDLLTIIIHSEHFFDFFIQFKI
jgi:hypothetical protein